MIEESSPVTGRPRRFPVPTLVAGLVIGVLVAGGVAPFVGGDRTGTSSGTPDFLAGGTGGAGEGTESGSAPGAGGEGSSDGTSGGSSGLPATSGGTAGTGSVSGTGGSAPVAGGEEPRGASDIGVTESTIRVGAATLNCKACAAFGIDIDTQPIRVYAQAFVDDINQRGGINGRKLELYTADYDPAEDAVSGGGTQRAACLELTENRKVFAVVQGTIDGNACIYDEQKTPLIASLDSVAEDPDSFNRTEGRIWLTDSSSARKLLDFARQLDRQQLITKTTKWGLVYVENVDAPVRKHLLAELERLGHTPAHVSVLPNDTTTINVKIAQEVPAMRSKGVTHVVSAANFLAAQFWVRESSRNGWKPQYLLSDFPSAADDFSGGQMAQGGDITGAIAVSSLKESTLDQRRRDPDAKPCFDTYERVTGNEVTRENEVGWLLAYCNTLHVFELAMKNAGVNPTRPSFIRALAGIGQFRFAGSLQGVGTFGGVYSLGGVKWSATDFGQRKVWQEPCPRPGDGDNACWVPVGPIYPMAA